MLPLIWESTLSTGPNILKNIQFYLFLASGDSMLSDLSINYKVSLLRLLVDHRLMKG